MADLFGGGTVHVLAAPDRLAAFEVEARLERRHRGTGAIPAFEEMHFEPHAVGGVVPLGMPQGEHRAGDVLDVVNAAACAVDDEDANALST